jgi:uncharacterized protein YbjT (DUF2867 family)
MTNQKWETLIVGGAGKTGRRVEQRLRALGVSCHLASRSAARRFDWNDEQSWGGALRGIRAAYLAFYPDLAAPGAADKIGKLSRLAAESGVERLVLLSGRGEHQVWPAERALRDAGLPFTIVRCAWFCQNFSEGHLLDDVLRGTLEFPAGEVREPFVDLDDVADVVTAALTDARHEGQIYDLTGPRLLTFADAMAEISRASGQRVSYRAIDKGAYASVLAQVMPAAEADFLSELFAQVLDGHNALLSDGVERALGRKPRDFSEFARDAARAGVWANRTETKSPLFEDMRT